MVSKFFLNWFFFSSVEIKSRVIMSAGPSYVTLCRHAERNQGPVLRPGTAQCFSVSNISGKVYQQAVLFKNAVGTTLSPLIRLLVKINGTIRYW
jgi:hypothetical protein